MKIIVELIRNILTRREKSCIIKLNTMPNSQRNSLNREDCQENMVRNITNRIIQNYWKYRVDGQKIACTRTKIGKLLTVVNILSIKCKDKPAFEDIIVSETCGTSVPILSVYRYPYDIWELGEERTFGESAFSSKNNFFEQDEKLTLEQIEEVNEPLPELYKIKEAVDETLNRIIDDVFMEFGAYDSYDIGDYINAFKSKICNEEVVDNGKVRSWLTEIQTQTKENNKLIEFISNYSID